MSPEEQRSELKWPLRVVESQYDGVRLVEVSGRLGHMAAATLLDRLTAAMTKDKRLIVDLARVDYVSSAGLTALHAAADALSKAGGTLVLCHVGQPVRIALDFAGLLHSFVIESSREDAVRSARCHP